MKASTKNILKDASLAALMAVMSHFLAKLQKPSVDDERTASPAKTQLRSD